MTMNTFSRAAASAALFALSRPDLARAFVTRSSSSSRYAPAAFGAGRSDNARPLRMSTEVSSSAATKSSTDGATHDDDGKADLSPDFAAARDATIETLRSALDTPSLLDPLTHFVGEYFTCCHDAYEAGVEGVTPQLAAGNILKCIDLGMTYGSGSDRYTFDVRHVAMRGKDPEDPNEDGNTFDYYAFGCDFFRPAINMKQSIVLGKENAEKAFKQIEDGDNVVFLANHQSEADPQVFSVLLESIGFGDEAAKVMYVAGHKVTTDPLAIPFSMGRNLLCIHSKKHIDADPNTKPVKQRQNMAAMSELLGMLKAGGASVWVAPSGGRDRRDLETGKVPIAHFDQKTVDMFRLMGNKSGVKTHFYPLSMVSYDLCPPPDHIEAGTGEQRNVRFVPIGIKICDEVANVGGAEKRHLFTDTAQSECDEGYDEVLQAIAEGAKKE